MPYNHKYNVLSVSLNEIFPSFFYPVVQSVLDSSCQLSTGYFHVYIYIYAFNDIDKIK